MYKDLLSPALALEQYRYLDALDSTRFARGKGEDEILYRDFHARAEILMALIMGEGIVISENQLLDSAGTIHLLASLVQEARRQKIVFPLRVALRGEPMSVYDVAAGMFSRIGNDEAGKTRFQLSAWPDLDRDFRRRLQWATAFSNHEMPAGEYVHGPSERELLSDLGILFSFVESSLRIRGEVIKARNLPHVFQREIEQILMLSQKDLYKMLMTQQPKGSVIMQAPWLESEEERLAAGEIVDALRNIWEDNGKKIVWRSVIYQAAKSLDLPKEVKSGLVEIADTLYNFVLGLATSSYLASDTPINYEHVDSPFVLAGNALAQWARETTWIPAIGGFDVEIPWGLYSVSRIEWDKWSEIDREKMVKVIEKMPWESCFQALINSRWVHSLAEYKYTLSQLQTIDKILVSVEDLPSYWQTRRRDTQQRLSDLWREHIALTSDLIANEWWRITKDREELRISPLLAQGMVSIVARTFHTKFDRDEMMDIVLWWKKKQRRKSVRGVISQLADAAKPEILRV